MSAIVFAAANKEDRDHCSPTTTRHLSADRVAGPAGSPQFHLVHRLVESRARHILVAAVLAFLMPRVSAATGKMRTA